jgi:hypothetical protein
MRLLAEYLEHAQQFERYARETTDAALKAQLLKQAADYRRLAERMALQLDVTPPAPPPNDSDTR